MSNNRVGKAIVWGFTGGFTATIIMDLACIAFFSVVGMPLDLTYSFIGDVAGGFFLDTGVSLQGGRLLGALAHFLIGLGLGGLFGLAVLRVRTFRVGSLGKGILLAIFYTEIFSQPVLATAPIFGHMTASDILQWYALSTVMHSIYGIVLGVTLSYGRPLFPYFQKAVSGSFHSRETESIVDQAG